MVDTKIILKKVPKKPTIIHGFPGFGLVGTIASEYLIEHLKVEQIGKITIEEMPAIVAVHNSKLVDPFGIFYSKKYNIVIVHAIAATQGFEWKLASFIMELAHRMQAKELISLEGIQGQDPSTSNSYVYSNRDKRLREMAKKGLNPLKEGIIIGVTGAILMKAQKTPVTAIFSESHSSLPDSKAAAKIIEALDTIIGLNIDYEPLLKQAENFEEKLQTLMKKGVEATAASDKKKMSYVG